MTNDDKTEFFAKWIAVAELYGNQQSDTAAGMAFTVLKSYSIAAVSDALEQHMASSKWMPKPSEIIDLIDGTLPTIDQIIGLARSPNTPISIFALKIIGNWNVENLNNFELKPLAENVLAELPEFIERARAGQYTTGEIAVMKKYGIDISGPISPTLPGPRPEITQELLRLAETIPAHESNNTENPKSPPSSTVLKLVDGIGKL